MTKIEINIEKIKKQKIYLKYFRRLKYTSNFEYILSSGHFIVYTSGHYLKQWVSQSCKKIKIDTVR